LHAEWARHPETAQREGETVTEYVRRLKAMDLDMTDAGPPVREAVKALIDLCSATEMGRLTGAGLEDLLRPTERN
jgi:hypothetical protein